MRYFPFQRKIFQNRSLLHFKWLIYLLLTFTSTHSAIAKPTQTLNIWTSSENVKKAILSLTGKFEKEFNATVTVDVLNKDLTTQFKTAAISSKGPDILCWAHDVVGELAESGLIEPITIPKALKSQFLDVAISAFTYRDRLYGYPYDLEAVALITNQDLVTKEPNSMEELVIEAKRIRKKNPKHYGFLFDINNLFFTFPILSSNGGYIFKNNKGTLDVFDVGLNSPGSIKAGEFLSSLIREKIVPPSTDRNIAFSKMKAGQLGFTIDGPWTINDLRKSGIRYKISPIPTLYGQTSRPFVGAHGFIVRRSSKNKELAKEFIEKYLVTRNGIKTLYQLDPRGPSRKDVLADLSQGNPELKAFMESASVGIPMPNVPEMGAVWSAMGGALNLIATGKSSVQEALTQAQIQVLSNIRKSRKK